MAGFAEPSARTRRLTEAAGALVWVAIGLLCVTVSIEHVFSPLIRALQERLVETSPHGGWGIGLLLLQRAILAAPALLMVCALLDLRAALVEYEQGRLFSPRAGGAVRSAGEWMLWALIAKTVIAPTVYSYATQGPGGVDFDFESFDVGVIATAAFVMLTGRILEAAAIMKAEHDQIV